MKKLILVFVLLTTVSTVVFFSFRKTSGYEKIEKNSGDTVLVKSEVINGIFVYKKNKNVKNGFYLIEGTICTTKKFYGTIDGIEIKNANLVFLEKNNKIVGFY